MNENNTIDAESLLENLIYDYTGVQQNMIQRLRKGTISKSDFMKSVENHIVNHYKPTDEVRETTIEMFKQYIFGYGKITPLIEDEDISDIRCIAHNCIRIKKNGKRMAAGIGFRNDKEYRNFIDFVATKNQVSISNLNAIQRFTDIDSSKDFILRFTISMPLINTYDNPYMSIRKVPKNFPEVRELVKKKMLSAEVAEILTERFREGSTLICGGNSSGKTTLLNALKETLPEDCSVLVTQQADELTTKSHPDMMFLHSLPGNTESQVSYDLEDISIAGLTMDVDYFIVGEIKGAEAMYLLNASYTGQICAATIHAPGADKAIEKAVDYSMYESRYSRDELMKMMSCFHTVVFMRGYKVEQIYEVLGWDESNRNISYRSIYERRGEES